MHGIGTAINVGDYLIGLGYRLVSRDRKELGAEVAADILDKFADAHLKLSEGQGAELLWRDAADKALTTLDALKIYALKTSPAFEAALYTGVRLAGSVERYEKMIADFSRNIGVAFQILNDIKDWSGDEDNKLVTGQDVLAARPTLLLALALEGLTPAQREELLYLVQRSRSVDVDAEELIGRVRHLYFAAKVFEKANKLVDKFKAKAEALADDVRTDGVPRIVVLPRRFRSGKAGTAATGRDAVRGTGSVIKRERARSDRLMGPAHWGRITPPS